MNHTSRILLLPPYIYINWSVTFFSLLFEYLIFLFKTGIFSPVSFSGDLLILIIIFTHVNRNLFSFIHFDLIRFLVHFLFSIYKPTALTHTHTHRWINFTVLFMILINIFRFFFQTVQCSFNLNIFFVVVVLFLICCYFFCSKST